MSTKTRSTWMLFTHAALVGGLFASPQSARKDTTSAPPSPVEVPDRIAHLHVFRQLADDGREDRDLYSRRTKALIAQIGLPESDWQFVLAAANEFSSKVKLLDSEAAEVNRVRREPGDPEGATKIQALTRRKEALIDQVWASLISKLSALGAERLVRFAREEVKPNVRLFKPGGNQ